jgi:thioredoxin-related protein
MKNLSHYTIIILLTGLFSFHTNPPGLKIGDTLPKADLKLKDISGKEITLAGSSQENGLLVMFSCNTCPYVIRNQQATKAVCSYALGNKIGVVLLNSNEGQRDQDDSYNDMKAYAKGQDYKWYYAVDKDNILADAFGASRTPECFLFDKSGKLVYHGAINDNPADPSDVKRMHLREAINEMLAGKAVSLTETRSVGCGIKRKG